MCWIQMSQLKTIPDNQPDVKSPVANWPEQADLLPSSDGSFCGPRIVHFP